MYYINPHDLEYVQWEPTSYCNANCIGCPRTDNETMLTKPYIAKFQRHASAEQVQYFIDSIVDERLVNLKTLQYNGNIGDAMMHPNIDDIIIVYIVIFVFKHWKKSIHYGRVIECC